MPVFLFTDIEGSTEKWERYKKEMGKALVRHDEIITKNIKKYNGEVIKHTGDGIFAIFEGGEPLQCALEIQKEFEEENWGDVGEIRMRMGLHAGYAEKRGEDYFGPVVNRTARVMAIAWGGQVVLTEDVKNVAELPEGASLKDMGYHLLKDLSEPQKIYQLTHPSLRLNEFPPLRSLSSHPNNLPVQMTPFLGREKELKKIIKLLGEPSCRLITLIGPGGIGKTRLALQSAAEKIEDFTNGVYFVPLDPLSSSDFLISAIAEALKFSFYSQIKEKVQLINYLKEKETLLILDNFEHLIEGASIISEILSQAPKVKILVTSRELLNLKGEWVVQLGGLEVPEKPGKEVINVGDYSAVQLFLHNARRMKADALLSEDERRYAIRICQLVGGMPLGIEIASSWVRTLSCKEIVQEIEKNLDFLSTSLRDMPERHRSLRAIFDSSWDLLTKQEQEAFMKLSVFRSSFTREAAENVTGVSLAILTALIDKSLLHRDSSGRYKILEILRKYAEAKLDENPKIKDNIYNLLSRYYADFLHRREKHSEIEEEKNALEDIGEEIENIRVAWRWALEHNREEDIEKSMGALFNFYDRRGRYREAEEMFGYGVNKLQKGERNKIIGKMLLHQGWFSFRLGNLKKAKILIEKSLTVFSDLNLRKEMSYALRYKGMMLIELGNYADAKECITEGLNISKDIKDKEGIASSYNYLGAAYYVEDLNKSKEFFQEGLKIYTEIGHHKGISGALSNLGGIEYYQGNYRKAKELFNESLTISQKMGVKKSMANTLANIGVVANALGDYDEARQLLSKSVKINKEIGDRLGMASAICNMADIYKQDEDYKKAEELFTEGLAVFRETGHISGVAEVLLSLGEIRKIKGDLSKAKDFFDEALSIQEKIANERGIAKALIALGEVYYETKDYKKAQEYLYKSLRRAAKLKATGLIAITLADVTKCLLSSGQEELAYEVITFVSPELIDDERMKKEVKEITKQIESKLTKQNIDNISKKAKTKKLEDILKIIK